MLKRTLLPLLVMIIAACAARTADEPPPSWIVGKYHYSGSGSVAKKFPWDAQSDLLLDRDGQYTLSVTVHIEDKEGSTNHNESYGSYYVDGTRLVLQPASEDDDDGEQKFDIRGKQLVPEIKWTARLALKGLRIPSPVFVKTD